MKAIDTNILVRFLVRDDAMQAETVKILFERAEKKGDSYFVCTTVILELIWVLKSVYELSDDDIKTAFGKMLQLQVLEFEDRELVAKFVNYDGKHIPDLSDQLIGLNARKRGCNSTLTFDRKASTSDLFELIR